jgi:hypothetical protein
MEKSGVGRQSLVWHRSCWFAAKIFTDHGGLRLKYADFVKPHQLKLVEMRAWQKEK